ncbi:MAG: 2-hydroxyglutaryl-CoA dehydratase D-component [Clostridia bacterium 62_21]|nr:MAG: 2-hydroxyglutaryl-CoA dehydratase D-component [Clostridia bacterium 62_21]HAG07413.1 3-hydroxyacyl-ACP dehydratase [Peptococcaceae bacterium]
MADYTRLWSELGLDLEAHEKLLQALPPTYYDVYLAQENRPRGMEYFDFVVNEIHGLRVQELQDFRQKGGKVVGTFCVFVPEELILAAGGVYAGLCAGIEIGTAQAEAVLPRNICPLIKSFMGFKLARVCPYFESCDLLVGETTCDGKKKAFEVLADFAPVHVMETPQKKEPRDRELWLEEVHTLAARLEDLTGKRITRETLTEAIRKVNAKRRALQRLGELRKADPPPLSGRDALLIYQIAFYDDVERFTAQVNALCDELEERVQNGVGVVARGTPRLVVTGTPMAIPNWKLPYIAETSGAVIVAEELCTGARYYEALTDEEGATLDDLLANVAARHLEADCACFTPNTRRLEKLLEMVRAYRADGVISYVLSFCDPYAVENYQVEKVLKQAGVPVLKVETDYSPHDAGQLKTRVQAFLEMLGAVAAQAGAAT